MPAYSAISNYLSSGSLFSSLIVVILVLSLLVYLLFVLINMLLKNNIKKTVEGYAHNMTLLAMREEVLKGIDNEESQRPQVPLVMFKGQAGTPVSMQIPYELLGFYMEPVEKPSALDKVFYWATIVLGGAVTLFTFIWGIL